MPSTDSGGPEKVDAMPSERVVGMAQNEWTASIGIDGRHGPDYACRRRGTTRFRSKEVTYEDRLTFPGYVNRVLLRDEQAPQWIRLCVAPPGGFGVWPFCLVDGGV
jgi:hypothetical protein